jgi:hypothetical protein
MARQRQVWSVGALVGVQAKLAQPLGQGIVQALQGRGRGHR